MGQNSLTVWMMAARPKTLWAAIAPVLIGTALAAGDNRWHLLSAFTALFSAVMIQIGTNLANDYYDFKKGTDQSDRLGPTRVTQAGLVSPKAVRLATTISFGLAFLGGIYLVYRGGWPIAIIGLLSILFGLLYTAGPFSLSYTGLADIFVLIFFGPIAVAGTHYVQTLTFSPTAALIGVAPGLFSVGILTVNNLRDIESDRRAQKKSLAVRFGRRAAKIEFLVCVSVAILWPLLFMFGDSGHPWSGLALLSLLAALPTIKIVLYGEGVALNAALAGTGRTLFLYASLFSVGWLI